MAYFRKGQIDIPIISFLVIVIVIILIAPLFLKIFYEVKDKTNAVLGNISGAEAVNNFNAVMDKGIDFWDRIMVFVLFLAVLLLFISAFMIDTHPFWVVLYILIAFVLILLTPNIMDALAKIYDSPSFGIEVGKLTFMNYIRLHYAEFLVGIFVITGIILYGKLKLFPSNRGGA